MGNRIGYVGQGQIGSVLEAQEEFGFDSGSVGRHFRFLSKGISWRKWYLERLIWGYYD